jgi:hypothetical protein|tara:strand:+ start:191 stop:865 length:675 start_codon:yes stop_codon:yes gene_type:complete
MKVLKIGQSLVSMPRGGGWSPDDETSLVAWYKNAAGIVLNGSDVSRWNDSSSNSHDMLQATASEQPAYSNGVLTFDSSTSENLQTSSQITLDGKFTIGFRANPTETNVVIIGDNTTSNEFIKYSTTTRIIIKIGGTSKNLNLGEGSFGDDYIVISRDASNVITLYHNGTAQESPQTLAGDCLIDAIGVRATDVNPYNGTVEEIQIFSDTNATLIANVNSRLAGI